MARIFRADNFILHLCPPRSILIVSNIYIASKVKHIRKDSDVYITGIYSCDIYLVITQQTVKVA